jgi:hypothetical protein
MPRVLTTEELRKLKAVDDSGRRVLFTPKPKEPEVQQDPQIATLQSIHSSLERIAAVLASPASADAVRGVQAEVGAVRRQIEQYQNQRQASYHVVITKRDAKGAILGCRLSPINPG